MLFNSIDFLIFLIIVLVVLWCIPAKIRQVWLLVSSYFFYMCWEAKYIVLIFGSTLVTYFSAIIMEKFSEKRKKKLVMFICVGLNLGLLFFFKYLNFCIGTISFFRGRTPEYLKIVLPVGISFYIFQALGYTIDCYREETKPEHNFITYALFVSFFPQLVAGPIERSKNLLHQIKKISIQSRKELFTCSNFQEGFILIVWGMFMKLVIADRVAILVDNIYSNVYLYGSVGLIMALFGFGIQIYCDFGSYSMIAIGTARIIGITLMENFAAPYFSTSITDFWRKWHISLSTWLRDYLYIPLGGSRKGKPRKLLNLLIVFLVSGLWHGANWTFVFWGAIHGFMIVVENLLRPFVRKIEGYFEVNKDTAGFMLCRALPVTLLVDFAWIFFRSESFEQAFAFIYRLFCKGDWWILSSDTIYTYGLDVQEMAILFGALFLLVVIDFIRARKSLTVDKWLMGEFALFRVFFLVAIMMITIIFGIYGPGFDSKEFIYFQF